MAARACAGLHSKRDAKLQLHVGGSAGLLVWTCMEVLCANELVARIMGKGGARKDPSAQVSDVALADASPILSGADPE